MYAVVGEEVKEFTTLDEAMKYAKTLGVFVTIEGGGMQICGVFGVAGIENGKLPSGHDYTFFKRRDSLKARRKG